MTAQAHECLILDGEETSMMTCPGIPGQHPRIAEGYHSGNDGGGFIGSTACWRRYIGTWEIREKKLFLRWVIGAYDLKGDEPLLADWYSGTLRIPRGEMIHYVHSGYGSIYAKELYIKVRRGKVVKQVLKSRHTGNRALNYLSKLPVIGKYFGKDSLLVEVGSVVLNFVLPCLGAMALVLLGPSFLEAYVPGGTAILNWASIAFFVLVAFVLLLVALVFLAFKISPIRRWIEKKFQSPSLDDEIAEERKRLKKLELAKVLSGERKSEKSSRPLSMESPVLCDKCNYRGELSATENVFNQALDQAGVLRSYQTAAEILQRLKALLPPDWKGRYFSGNQVRKEPEFQDALRADPELDSLLRSGPRDLVDYFEGIESGLRDAEKMPLRHLLNCPACKDGCLYVEAEPYPLIVLRRIGGRAGIRKGILPARKEIV